MDRSLPIWEQRICKALVDFFKTKKIIEPASISIFVSYAYDNAACHKIVIIPSEEYKRKADVQQGGVWKEFKRIA